MSDTQIVTTETPHNPQRSNAGTAAPVQRAERGERGRLVQTVQHGSVIATPTRGEGATVQTIKSTRADAPRTFSEKLRGMLDNLDKHDDVRGPDTIEEAKPDAAKPESKEEPKAPPVVAKPIETTAAKPEAKPEPAADKPVEKPAVAPDKPQPDAELTARAARLTEHNKRLVTELEQLRAKRSEPEPDERMKELDAIERSLTTDFVGSIRKLVALNAGIKDPASPEVDRLMAGGYYEWTSKELGIPLDDAKRAVIGSDRNRLLIERDKRERDAKEKTEEAKGATARESAKHDDIGRQLGKQLEDAKHAERYPLMMKLAQRIDGQSPGALLWSAIRRGIQSGEFPQDTPDDKLINHYSQEIESHYTPIGEAFAGGSSSTAPTPTPATVPPVDQKADAPQAGARTITNASASVAPPAPPVAATPPAETDRPRKVSEETRRRLIAAKYFPD